VTKRGNVQQFRAQAGGAVVLIAVQSGLGMFFNLFVTIPKHHSGANPSEYFSGSARSVLWAISHGAIALTLHAVLGLLLGLMVIGIVARAISIGRRSLLIWSVLGALGSIGAGFTGAAFLDFHSDPSSFLMSILALGSLLCFAVVLYVPGESVAVASAAPPPRSKPEAD
jgi:hypothetical protein